MENKIYQQLLLKYDDNDLGYYTPDILVSSHSLYVVYRLYLLTHHFTSL